MTDSIIQDTRYLSGLVYHNSKYTKNLGYQLLKKQENTDNGFFAEAYYKNGKIIIVYRGTDMERGGKEATKDLRNDVVLLARKLPSQYYSARLFYNYIARKYRNYPVYATGHSLGGSLAQMLGASVKEVKAVTYNAFGTGDIKGFSPKYPENVINYGHSKDVVFNFNINSQVGKTYVTDPKSMDKMSLRNHHRIEDMGEIDSVVEYKPFKGKATGYAAHEIAGISEKSNGNLLTAREEKLARYSARLSESPEKIKEQESKHVTLEELKASQEAKKQKVRDIIEGKVQFDENKDYSSYENKKNKDNKIFTQEEIETMTEEEKRKIKK